MNSQPPSSTSLPSGLQNPTPPTFATFMFSPGFGDSRAQTDQGLGRPRTLTERMGLGPRVIPFKPTSRPLAGLSRPSKAKPPPMLDTEMFDASVVDGEQPRTNLLLVPSVDTQTLSSAAKSTPQEKEPPPDIWGYAKLVQDEWASVERPSLPAVVHQAIGAVNLGENRNTGTQGSQKVTKTLAFYPNDDHALLPDRLGPVIPPPSSSPSHGLGNARQGEEVIIEREGLEPSLLSLDAPMLALPGNQRQPKRELNSTMVADVPVKKEEPSHQYLEAAARGEQSSTMVNVSQSPPFVGKQVEEQIVDLFQAENAAETGVIRENGTSLNKIRFDTGLASPSRREFSIEKTTDSTSREPAVSSTDARATADVKPPSPRGHHTPLQGPSTSNPFLPARPSPPLVQTVDRRGNEPTRTYQGNTHRESASTPASVHRLKHSIGYTTHLGTGGDLTFDNPRDVSSERGRDFTRHGLSTLPSGSYRHYSPTRSNSPLRRFSPTSGKSPRRRYSPMRGDSPPRHSNRDFEGRPMTRTPPHVESIHHRPRRPSPHTPPPRILPRRASDTYNRQNGRTSNSYRPSRSRSRSPPRRWTEMEYAQAQLVPRGPRNGDMKRGPAVTYPAHNTRPRPEWRTPANSSEPYRRKFEGPSRTRSPKGALDSYRPTQPMPSRQPVRIEHDSYRPRRGSPGSDRQSPMSAELEKPRMLPRGNVQKATSRGVSDAEASHRSSSIEDDVPINRHTKPWQGSKRKKAEVEEPRNGLVEQSPITGPEPVAKRRRIDEEDVGMEVSLANPGKSGSVLEGIPPTRASLVASVPVTMSASLEEYPSLPPLIPTGNRNKLLMRMEGNNYGLKLSQPAPNSLGPTPSTSNPTSSDDPDDILHQWNMHGASPHAIRDSTDNTKPPASARVSLNDRFHHIQSQNNPQPYQPDSTLPSISNTPIEDSRKLPSRRASGSKPTPPQRVSISESQQPAAALIGRIDLNQTPVSQLGEHVIKMPNLRGPRQTRPHPSSGDDQEVSQPLEARLGLRADEAAPPRPHHGSKVGRGGATFRAPGGDLAARLD